MNDYEFLFEKFLNEVISVDEFQETYLELFKNEGEIDADLFKLLDELFGDIDSFTSDPLLLTENSNFYLDEAQLRQRVRQAATRFLDLKRLKGMA